MKIIGTNEVRATGRNSVRVQFEVSFDDPAGTYILAPLRPGQYVIDGGTQVRTAFNATSPSATIGDATTAAGYLSNATIALATAQTAGAPAIKKISGGGGAYANGKVYSAADSVILTWSPGTSGTAGRLVGWLEIGDLSLDGIEA